MCLGVMSHEADSTSPWRPWIFFTSENDEGQTSVGESGGKDWWASSLYMYTMGPPNLHV